MTAPDRWFRRSGGDTASLHHDLKPFMRLTTPRDTKPIVFGRTTIRDQSRPETAPRDQEFTLSQEGDSSDIATGNSSLARRGGGCLTDDVSRSANQLSRHTGDT
ncbi:hypothetical protein [Streptomyces xinghaiensis]|uniref:hypothetical protein n=1 Tax=Streptomyces xinghaiensis TaxID=1038928 RepID=UPI0034188453